MSRREMLKGIMVEAAALLAVVAVMVIAVVAAGWMQGRAA